jgi:hypothetical protein
MSKKQIESTQTPMTLTRKVGKKATEKVTVGVVKAKRGRPKGSKKTTDATKPKAGVRKSAKKADDTGVKAKRGRPAGVKKTLPATEQPNAGIDKSTQETPAVNTQKKRGRPAGVKKVLPATEHPMAGISEPTEKHADASTQKKRGRKKGKKDEAQVAKVPSALIEIYGSIEEKSVLPFPKTDFQTQSKNLIIEYGIRTPLLPEEIIAALNALITDFTYFVENQAVAAGMIGVIMDKDLYATNLLKAWIEPRKALLLSEKESQTSDSSPTASVNSGASGIYSEPSPVTPLPEEPHSVHQNTFHPRTPESTYNHSFALPPSTENKDIHYQVLSQADAGIKAQNHAQQNWQGEGSHVAPVIDRDKIFKDYCVTIGDTMRNSFQHTHWGFIPESEARIIISQLDQSYKYSLVVNGEHSYLEVSNDSRSKRTEFFCVK